ncbi:MAG: hypothetical protein KatS3mg034_1508 [Vicingaceae bacterium]|nr:MAG: hypothetical protein KatS3mg034_1508 [Vicingaceae bacterium]
MKNNLYNRIIPRFFAFFWLFAIFFQLFFANRLAGEMKFNTSPDKVILNQGFFLVGSILLKKNDNEENLEPDPDETDIVNDLIFLGIEGNYFQVKYKKLSFNNLLLNIRKHSKLFIRYKTIKIHLS